MNTKIQIIVTFIVGIIIGFTSSSLYFKQVSKNSYQEGFNTAKTRIEKSSFGAILLLNDIRNISGTVTKIDGNNITVNVQTLDPLEDGSLNSRIVTITPNTKISKTSSKDIRTIQTEMDAFIKSAKSVKNNSNALPPLPYTITLASVQDIIIGKNISISASENIKTKKEFIASEIAIQ